MSVVLNGIIGPEGGGGGSGDVVGPASSVDNNIATFDGATGKLIQDSGVAIASLVTGSTGATDNAILRADGTGGSTVQSSAVTIADTTGTLDNSSGVGKYISGGSNGAMYFGMGGTGVSNYGLGLDGNGVPSIINGNATAIGQFRVLKLIVNDGTTAPEEISFSATGGYPKIDVQSSSNWFRLLASATEPGVLVQARQVEASTSGSGSPNVLVALESNKVLTNEGATAVNYHTLPTAVAGYVFTFVCQDADGIRITANTGDTIRVIDKVTAAAGYIESTTIGSCVTLVAINAVEWYATSIKGVWTDGTFTYDDTSLTTP